MGLVIEDGLGTGQLAQVEDNRLEVCARTLPRIAYNSWDRGTTFSWSYTFDPAAADTLLLVSNSDTQKLLYIHAVLVGSDTNCQWAIHSPPYPTLAGTVVTGVNTNRTSGKIALAEAYGGETGNNIANGVVFYRGFSLAYGAPALVLAEGSVVLGYHQIIAVDLVGAANPAAATCTILGWYE